METPQEFIVTTSPGLEEMLSAELKDLGLNVVGGGAGGVRIACDWKGVARVLTESRIGSRVLKPIREFPCKNPQMLYDQVRRIAWPKIFSSEQTFAIFQTGQLKVDGFAQSFATLKIKDALCDEFKKQGFMRPDVGRQNPQVRLQAHFASGRCELSMDLAGTPLHRRGYREESAEAPLRENRAASLLRFAKFEQLNFEGDGELLMDPFCGSGTIVIEALLMAQKRAPGLMRPVESYAAWNLVPEIQDALIEARAEAEKRIVARPKLRCVASDEDRDALRIARMNARRAGVEELIEFRNADARTLETGGVNAWIITNPPWGERLLDQNKSVELLGEFTRHLKHHCAPARLALVVARGPLENAVGFKPTRKLNLQSSDLELGFRLYELYAGRKGS